jgi:hypothetical protein
MADHAAGYGLLATLADLPSARLAAARLRSEGIETRLHGEALGPYPLTVGQWALTQLWVPAGCLDEARRIMLEIEVDGAIGGLEDAPEGDDSEPSPTTPVGVLMAIALLLTAALVGRLVLLVL